MAFFGGVWVNRITSFDRAKENKVRDSKVTKKSNEPTNHSSQITAKPSRTAFGGALDLPEKVEVEDVGEFILDENGKLVQLHRPTTSSEDVEKALKEYLEALRRKLQQAELARSRFEIKNFDSSSFAKVTISKPTKSEVDSFQEMLRVTASKLPEAIRAYYLVDGQRMIDQYAFVRASYLVLFVHQAFQAASFDNQAANYWEFYTDQPHLYSVSDEGQIRAPQGVITYYTKPWLESFKPPERYKHLFKAS